MKQRNKNDHKYDPLQELKQGTEDIAHTIRQGAEDSLKKVKENLDDRNS